jgi:hypothetical protein
MNAHCACVFFQQFEKKIKTSTFFCYMLYEYAAANTGFRFLINCSFKNVSVYLADSVHTHTNCKLQIFRIQKRTRINKLT